MSKIVNIQVLRGGAAATVVVAHTVLRFDDWAKFPETIGRLVDALGALAVDTFFIISGVIMVLTARDLFGRAGGVTEFAARRLVRIVPLYWLAIGVEVALRARHANAPSLADLARSLFFIPYSIHPGQPLRPIVGVGWTLNYEMMFYALFALALLLPFRLGIAAVLTALVATVCAGALLVKPLSDTSLPTTVAGFCTDPILLMFGAGCLLAVAYGHPGLRAGLSITHTFKLVAALCAICIAAIVRSEIGPGTEAVPHLLLRVAMILLVLLALFGAPVDRGPVGRLGRLVGDASYSLYLFHFPVIVAVEKLWLAAMGPHQPVPALLTAIAIAHVACVSIHLAVETPMMEGFRRVSSRSPGRAALRKPQVDPGSGFRP